MATLVVCTKKRVTPPTGEELRNLCDRFGSDRLARLWWEISRLRLVVMHFYRHICRLSYDRPHEAPVDIDEHTEAILDSEPVIMENTRKSNDDFKYGPVGRTCPQKLS